MESKRSKFVCNCRLTASGCPVMQNSQVYITYKHNIRLVAEFPILNNKLLSDFSGGDGEIRPPRFCARRHSPGHLNSPPDCFYASHCPFRISHYIKKQAHKSAPDFYMAETARFELAGDCSLTDFEFYKVRVKISQFRVSFC